MYGFFLDSLLNIYHSSIVPSPPTELLVKTRTTEAFTVTWTAPASQMLTGYIVTISEGDNVMTETATKDVTSVEITGLAAGTAYSVTVITANDQDESAALTETASTGELKFDYSIVI